MSEYYNIYFINFAYNHLVIFYVACVEDIEVIIQLACMCNQREGSFDQNVRTAYEQPIHHFLFCRRTHPFFLQKSSFLIMKRGISRCFHLILKVGDIRQRENPSVNTLLSLENVKNDERQVSVVSASNISIFLGTCILDCK